jgi:heme iron utilization protein
MTNRDKPGAGAPPAEGRALGRAMANSARDLLRGQSQGVLATLSQKKGGWPFASLTPYALSPRGEPIFLMSGLAQHTRNVLADPRACLYVQEDAAGGDSQQAGRIALMGRVAPVPEAELADARARYLERHPQAEQYLSLGDFSLYRMAVVDAHAVGGFARAGWLSAADILEPEG